MVSTFLVLEIHRFLLSTSVAVCGISFLCASTILLTVATQMMTDNCDSRAAIPALHHDQF